MNSTERNIVILFPQLCEEPLWNTSSMWHTEAPHFGRCFERTVLVWLPCFVLCVAAPFYAFALKQRPRDPLPWSGLASMKVIMLSMMIVTAAVEDMWAVAGNSRDVTTADILAPLALLLTYMLHLKLLLVGRQHGERSSCILWIHWLVTVVAGIPQLVTAITTFLHQDGQLPPLLVATTFLQYLGALVLLIASCVNDLPSPLQKKTRTENPNPELDASFLSRITFFYAIPLIWRGWQRPLTLQDLPDVLPANSAEVVYRKWQCISNSMEKHIRRNMGFDNDSPKVSTKGVWKVSLVQNIWQQHRSLLLLVLLNGIVYMLLVFIGPVLVGWLVAFMETPEEPAWHGHLYAVCLLVSGSFRIIFKNFHFKLAATVAIRIKTALMAAVYEKALHLSSASRRSYTLGKLVNLMSADTQAVADMYLNICYIIISPFTILICLAFLWAEIGPSSLAGVLVLGLLMVLSSCLLSCSKKISVKAMAVADKRIKAISEIISGIKVLKLYAWEASFSENVKHIRDKEIRFLRELAILQAISSFLYNTVPFLVSLATFACYLLVSEEENQLNTQKIFICLALFDVLKMPAVMMPEAVARMITGTVSLRRIETYLNADELDPLAVTACPSEDAAVKVEGGYFVWEGDEEQTDWRLKDIELTVPHGRLVALVGSVGAGKSSILSALLGEMKKDAGKVVVNGSVAYVPQIPWVQNATLRDNITWGKPYEPKRYWQVVQACALQLDFDMLPAGDMTEIGENGINISGGQKQRVSLARAVYSGASIFLLDDPLSAVDSHVGRHIFDQVLGPCGILKDKTRILVTHAVTFLPLVDEVVVVGGGRIQECGSHAELLAAEGDFANFLLQHMREMEEEEEAEEELEVLCSQMEGLSGRTSLYRQLSETRLSMKSRKSSVKEQRETIDMSNSPSSSTTLRRRRNITKANPHLQHQPSTDNYFKRTTATSHHRKSNTASFDKYTAKDKHNPEPLAGKVKGQTLVKEESSEVGRVSINVYLVYGRAMGFCLVITAVVIFALAEVSNTGSSMWLAHWSPSQHTLPTHTTRLTHTSNPTDGLNLTDSTRLTENTHLRDMNLTDCSFTDFTNLTDTTFTHILSDMTSFLDFLSLPGTTGLTDRDIFLTMYGILAASQSLLLFLAILLTMVGTIRAANTLHSRLFSSVVRFPMSFFDTNPSGRIINRFSKEMENVDKNLPPVISSFFVTFLQVVVRMAVIIISTPTVTFFVMPTLCVYVAIQQVFVASARQVKRFQSTSKSPMFSHFSESINGVSVVRAFKRESEFFFQYLQKIDDSLKSIYTNRNNTRWLCLYMEGVGNVIVFAAAVSGVANHGSASSGAVGLSVTSALSVMHQLLWLVRMLTEVESSIVSVENIYEYIQMPQEAPWRINTNVPPPAWPKEGAIEFHSYETRYRPGLSLVLQDITCCIRPAEKVGIVGRTGAGKSSLMMALFRILEASGGRIVIDGTTISSIGLHDLRERISIIPQDAMLFSGTLRMNLDPLGQHSDTELWRVLKLAHLSDYISQQVLGLLHPVDQGGANFSVGQRQLVCLARALLRHSQVLVLDEATAAIDLETDRLIQATIHTQFAQCTIITIAHRLNTIMDYDRVVVLQAGRIAEFDAPSVLLQRPSSLFYSLAKDAGIV